MVLGFGLITAACRRNLLIRGKNAPFGITCVWMKHSIIVSPRKVITRQPQCDPPAPVIRCNQAYC